MKSPLLLAKSACILLFVALMTILAIAANDITVNYKNVNLITFVVLFSIITSASSYFVTIRHCNKIAVEDGLNLSKKSAITFLILAIIGFVFSIFVLVILIRDIMNGGLADFNRMISKNADIKSIIVYFSSLIFAIFGPITFFLQLYVRKTFLLKAKTSTNKLIDSIGVDENNL